MSAQVSGSPATFELDAFLNDNPTFQIQFFLNDGTTPINLTNYTVKVRIKNFDGSLLGSVAITATVTDQVNGKIQFSLSTTYTGTSGTFDVAITATNGNVVLTLAQGKLVVTQTW